MRRKEREITNETEIEKIISNCGCCRLGFNDDGNVYIVPLDFGYIKNDGKYIFYFHGAKAGRKYELLKKSPTVAFEMDRGHELRFGETACGCTAAYQSVMGSGKAEIVEDEDEKRKGLDALMKHDTGKSDWEFSREMIEKVCVFRLSVDSLSAKARL